MSTNLGPGIMPIDREAWGRQLGLCNFINSYYQLRDLTRLPFVRRVLIIGPGQGLDPVVLRWRGFNVTTFDIDTTFAPDVLGSVRDMGMFHDGEFDAAVASHVLEHLPFDQFDSALGEIARVSKHAIVYLPVNGLNMQFRFSTNLRDWEWSKIIDVRKWWHKPDAEVARFMSGQHYWELGLRGCSVKTVRAKMGRLFDVVDVYRNHDWRPSMNFVLTSRQNLGSLPRTEN